MAEYFENENVPEEERRDTTLQVLNGVREAVSMAKRGPQPVTYEQTMDLIHDLDPSIYDSIVKLLKARNESDDVKYFKEMAEALSGQSSKVLPVDLIREELSKLDKIIGDQTDKKSLARRKYQLHAALKYFEPRKVSEHKILAHDFYLAERPNWRFNPQYSNDSFRDYALSDKRKLRMRLLHPDKEEEILGADLIYEQYDLQTQQVRFVHLQYKTISDKSLYFSQGNLGAQLDKMDKNLCKSGLCAVRGQRHSENYRLPYCASFLRPTNKTQSANSKIVSTGLHVPTCEVLKFKDANGAGSIRLSDMRERGLSYKIFEEMFVSDLLGSPWISIDDLDVFYQQKGIASNTDVIRVHAQEVLFNTEQETYRQRDEPPF